MSPEEYERCQPLTSIVAAGHTLRFATPSPANLRRLEAFVREERDTVAWLKALPEGATLLDVGAGIGLHAVYAAVIRKARVFAFEPEAQNYAVLCRNLLLNGAAGRATAWCAALSEDVRLDEISAEAGASVQACAAGARLPLRLQSLGRTQGSVATTIDAVVAAKAIQVPHAVRIDLDSGSEHQVIRGARTTLQDPAVRTLAIRIDPASEAHRWIVDHLAGLGFATDPDQVKRVQEAAGGAGAVVFARSAAAVPADPYAAVSLTWS